MLICFSTYHNYYSLFVYFCLFLFCFVLFCFFLVWYLRKYPYQLVVNFDVTIVFGCGADKLRIPLYVRHHAVMYCNFLEA